MTAEVFEDLPTPPTTTARTLPLADPPPRTRPSAPPVDERAKVPIVKIGEIRIPKIGLVHPIYEGVTLTVVDRGPGHWPGSAVPGQLGNAVFAGHRVTHSHPFRHVDKLVPGDDVSIALDLASSQFGGNGWYQLALEQQEFDSDALRERLVRWIDKYPIVSIEDPLAEDDEGGLIAFTRAVGEKVQIVGDDYLVTNEARVKHAASVGACNCLLVKPNQAGTVTETRAALDAAKQAGYSTIVSARSGETEDAAIAHLAIGWNAGQLKVGSFARSERMAKWNEALRIESRSGLPFAGRTVLRRR